MNDDEKDLRDAFSKEIGLEFCSEDDLQKEIEIASEEMERQISVTEIIQKCNEAGQKMGKRNPNRYLFYLCATALKQMVDRLAKYESGVSTEQVN